MAEELKIVSDKLTSLSFDSTEASSLRDIFFKSEKDIDRTIIANAFVEHCDKPVVPQASALRQVCSMGDLCLKMHGDKKTLRRSPFD